jgi:hypothetical protein
MLPCSPVCPVYDSHMGPRHAVPPVPCSFLLLAASVHGWLRVQQPVSLTLCDGLCDGGRCVSASEASAIEAACRSLAAGERRVAVGQRLLSSRDAVDASALQSGVAASNTHWVLDATTLAVGGGAACLDALQSQDLDSLMLSSACSSCVADAARGGGAVLVGLHGCTIQAKALAMRTRAAAIIAIARRPGKSAVGLYSRQAVHYMTPTGSQRSTLADQGTPTVMVEKAVGLALLALLSFRNATLRVEIHAETNAWDVEARCSPRLATPLPSYVTIVVCGRAVSGRSSRR